MEQPLLSRLWRALRPDAEAAKSVDLPLVMLAPIAESVSGKRREAVAEPAATQPESRPRRIIYDVGSNNGDDLPYYLQKADLVIALEADPDLANQIRTRFSAEIGEGRLVMENCVVTVDASGSDVPFYIHQGSNVLSQFERPSDAEMPQFKEVSLPSKRLVDIVRKYGAPHYVKIDVEGYDHKLLAALFSSGIRPPYISAETHSVEVFATMVALGGYNAFKLVNGHGVQEAYRDAQIQTASGPATYSFPYHSAGPFGGDISGVWESANTFLTTLAAAGLGWADIHASAIDAFER